MLYFRRIIFLFILAALIAGVWIFSPFGGFFGEFVQIGEEYIARNKTLALVIFIALAALSVLLGPVTSIFLVPAALAVWGALLTFLFLMIGWFLGEVLSYGIGRRIGYAAVTYFVSKSKADKWLAYISERATFLFALAFRLALPAETGYIFGLVRYPFVKYIAIVIIAEIPFALAAVYAGEAFLEKNLMRFILWITAAALLIGGTAYSFQKKSRRGKTSSQKIK